MSTHASSEGTSRSALFLLSMVVLAFEVFLTRLVSYTVDLMLIYVVVGVAMLGSGAAGSLVAVRKGWLSPERVTTAIAIAAATFTISMVVSPALFVRLTPAVNGVMGASLLALVMTIPFLTSGVAVTLALSSAGARIGRVYASDLAGAAIGCTLPVALLGPLDGARFIALLVVASALAALLYFRASRAEWRSPAGKVLVLALALSALAIAAPRSLFPIVADPSGQATQLRKQAAERGLTATRVFDRWDPTGHISVDRYDPPAGAEPYPYMFYAQDGTAGSMLVKWSGPSTSTAHEPVNVVCTETIYAQGYSAPRPRVMIIGLGGAPDVQCALFHRAEHVDVVEINRTTIRAMTGDYSTFLGGIGGDPRVRYHARDGRSFAHASRGAKYDLIQLSGVDTKQVFASGALALSENHLYTEEALRDYLEGLAPHGVLSIVRFGEAEQLRLINTAVSALRAMGVQHPDKHIVAIDNGFIIGVLIRREPFPDQELAAIARQHAGTQRTISPEFRPFFLLTAQRPTIAFLAGRASREPFTRFFAAVAANDTASFERSYPLNVTPTDDDRPFFFHIYPSLVPMSLLPFQILYGLLAAVIVLALALILVPAAWLRRRSPAGAPASAAWFFACVGAGFLLMEVWLIHRFALYLGHQTYAMSVVLGSLLIGAGTGALFGDRLRVPPERRVPYGVALIVALGLLGLFAMPPVLEATWSLHIALRVAIVFAFVFTLGLAMGLPFPAGLQRLDERERAIAPWYIGINWFASVMASVAATPLTMRFGYAFICSCALVAYVGAALLSLKSWRAPA